MTVATLSRDANMAASDSTRRRLLALLAVAAAVGVGVSFVRRQHSEWDDVYRAAGRRLLAGESLYPPDTNYAYPPLTAALVAPLANAGDRPARLAWYAVNLAAIGGLLVWGWRTSGGVRPVVQEPAVFWLGLAAGFPFVLHGLAHQQNDAVVAAVVVGGCLCLVRGRAFAGATCFGLAAAMKCTPLLFAPYLLVKGRPLAAVWVVVVAVGASLVPDLVSRPADASCHLEKWYDTYIAAMLRPDYAPGMWASEIVYNQSAVGAANRWFGETVPAKELKRAVYAVFAGLAVVGLIALRLGRRRPDAAAWGCGLVLAGMLILSPMSSVPHFATLLLPGWLLARAVVAERRWHLAPFLAVMVAGSLMSNKDLIGGPAYTFGLWAGSVMWAAVAAFLGCAAALATPPAVAADILPLPAPVPTRRAA